MEKIEVKASISELEQVQAFVRRELEKYGCSDSVALQLEIAVEEVFVNIAHYAYNPKGSGTATVSCGLQEDLMQVVIQFLDKGIPYNPLEKQDPDVTLDAGEREIGGLGIYMVKKSMDQVEYTYENGKNILTIHKNIVSDSF